MTTSNEPNWAIVNGKRVNMLGPSYGNPLGDPPYIDPHDNPVGAAGQERDWAGSLIADPYLKPPKHEKCPSCGIGWIVYGECSRCGHKPDDEGDYYDGYDFDPMDDIPAGTPDSWIPDNPNDDGFCQSDFI